MKKKVIKKIFIVLLIALIIFSIFNFVKFFTTGKYKIGVTTSSKFYTNDNLEAIVSVKDKKKNISIASDVKVELLKQNGKKVKGIKEKYKIEHGENANVSIPITDDIETGNYKLKITAKSGIFKDSSIINVSILNEKKSNVIISLDKGIYKPGDEVNFRALITSKNDDKPVSEKVTVSIYDGNENRVFFEEVNSTEFGIVSGKFNLANEVNSGEYKIKVETNTVEKTKAFTVNPYITPKFETSIVTDKENYLVGQTAKITINANYFFGEKVKNATVSGKINDKEFKGITNENGEFITNYEISEPGRVDVSANVIDSSNYLIEAKKSFYGSSDIFEIEILAENKEIIQNIDNDIYIITKKIDGTPVKTYATVNFGNISRQVITDESGIGKITLSYDDIKSINTKIYNYEDDYYSSNLIQSKVNVTAEDMEGNKVSKDCLIPVSNYTGTILKTDKVKYSQGEDITLELRNFTNSSNEKIAVVKNDKLLKIMSTENEKFSFNLEDTYGLVDIYLVDSNKVNNSYGDMLLVKSSANSLNNNYSKRTIFIKPSKELNIGIKTDFEEYKPGDNLNIEFTTKNEKNENVEAALMVSILDEAILNLAENDLSIDNIKLALEDIELTEDVTAADVYASVIDENSEHKLMTILLNQSSTNPNIITKNTTNASEKNQALEKAIKSGLIAIVLIFAMVSIKSKRFFSAVIHLINVCAIYILANICLFHIWVYDLDFPEIVALLINLTGTIVAYSLILYKQGTNIFKMLLKLALIPMIAYGIIDFVYWEISEILAYVILFIPPIIWTILTVISRSKKITKLFEYIKIIFMELTRIEIIYLLILMCIEILGIYSEISVILILIILYLISEKIYNKNKKHKKIVEGKVTFDLTGMEALGIGAGIGLIAIIIIGILAISFNFNTASSTITNSMGTIDSTKGEIIQSTMPESSSQGNVDRFSDFDGFTAAGNTSNSNGIFDFDLPNFSEEESAIEDSLVSQMPEVEKDSVEKENVEESVRNVFLESLAFIPELLTKNGYAKTDIKISDNITTWNIQTVGNTKEGNVGYATSKIKVFKDFFIDFSLPTNSVVTDKTSIPVTIYNYKDTNLNVSINVKENDWCKIGNYENEIKVESKQTKMIYIPIEIIKEGKGTLRIESKSGEVQDIVEKNIEITPNGIEKTKIIGSGTIEKNYSQDYFTTEEALENSRKLKVKLYPSMMSQVIEGMENIFRMPTGCFEQVSSSLYPNILALEYLKNTNQVNEEIKEKALNYISEGYQKILSYEVKNEKGGYSLYGQSPAEPVLTAYGLMEITDLSRVYDVEEKVIENMKEYLFKVQKSNGSFNIGTTYLGGATNTDDLAMNAYIIWALSESCPDDKRLEKSIEYLEDKIDKINDNYTKALVANVFINTKNKLADELIEQLLENIQKNGDKASISSNIRDYYGTCGIFQNIQTTALTSLALSKDKSNQKINSALINYIIENKDKFGTWGTTQSTVLALKAINKFNVTSDLSNQIISVKVNDEVKEIEIKDNVLDIYEFSFENINKENKISVEIKKGKIYYEIIEEYYVPYKNAEISELVKVSYSIDKNVKVNDIINQEVIITNKTNDLIRNGLVQINIPQGCSVIEESLSKMVHEDVIEKYEYNYGKINIYLRNTKMEEIVNLKIQYRALYPENITGALVRVYDYYNPNIEGIALPVNINININISK